MKGASLIAPFGLRMPEELREEIQKRAKSNGRSMNSEIVQILEDSIKKDGIGIPPLGNGNPDQKFKMESVINGKLESIEGTLHELLDYVKANKKPT